MGTRGRRDSYNDTWSWEPVAGDDGPRVRPPWRLVLPLILVVSLLAGIAGGVLVSDHDDDNASWVDDSGTPSLPATPTAATASPQQPTLTLPPTPVRTPTQATLAPQVHLFAWSRADKRWVESELPAGSGYREGEAIPVLLRIDHAAQQSADAITVFYEVIVRYQCATGKSAGIDFLASPAEGDSAALLSEPAPGRLTPDSAVSVPDDPFLWFDSVSNERFHLWGGAFLRPPEWGTLPVNFCEREKEVHLGVGTTEDTVFLVWAAHLASARNWGDGQGSASAGGPLSIEVAVIGAGEASLSVADGAVLP